MNAEILSVGTEILLGDIVNTNAAFVSRQLAQLGIGVYWQTVVGDNPERLERAMHNAFERADIIITTGGLGPTQDDLTKEIGAGYFKRRLICDERAMSRIKSYFDKMHRQMTENNKKQAFIPEGAIPLYNDNGTAPGIILEADGKTLIMLPGPPGEMQPMFEEQVKPYLAAKQDRTFVSRTLRLAAVGESAMESRVKDLINGGVNPTVAPYAKGTEAILRITASAKTEKEAGELIEPVAEEIYRRFGDNLYAEGETTMQATVAKLLLDKNKTVAVAESCTGGLVASRLIEYAGISQVFLEGAVTYSNDAKMRRLGVRKETLDKYGAVSSQTAIEMARGIALAAGTDIGLSTTGVAGPGPSEGKPEGLVYVGLFMDGREYVKELDLAGSRQTIRERAAYGALDMLRRKLILD